MRILMGLLIVVPTLAWAAALDSGLEIGTSVSHFHDGRSIFSNPAALGYQAELNGAGPLLSLTGDSQSEYSLGFGIGQLGFGVESLQVPDVRTRYHLGLGMPVGNYLFWGVRGVFVRPQAGGSYNAVDFGIQFRPSKYIAFGLLRTNLVGGAESRTVGSVTVRPHSLFTLNIDADTPSNSMGSSWAYQARLGAEVFNGIEVSVGYHSTYQWMAGVKANLGQAALSAGYLPNSANRQYLLNLSLSPRPYPAGKGANHTYKVKIDENLTDGPRRMGFLGGDRPTLLGLLEQLGLAAEQSNVRKVVVEVKEFPLGSASAQEVFEALARCREAGKTVEVYLGNSGLKEYLIASAANKIYLDQNATLLIPGLRSQMYFAKGTLDKIGIEAETLARGEYKSAPEMFNRTESSPANKEMTTALLREGEAQTIALLSRYRKIDEKKWQEIQKFAVFGAKDALAHGLIDEEGSFTKNLEEIKKSSHVRSDLTERSDRLALPGRIVVIVAEGAIAAERGGGLFGSGPGITPEKLRRQFSSAAMDPRTRAIVFRVNSPGGEVLPSDQIAEMVEEIKKIRRVPVIVSMGDVAASGGYMISAPATKIFVNPLSLTGSIGVFLGKPNLAELYKKIDLRKEVLTLSPHPSLMSEHKAWSPAEKEIMTRRLNQYYESFVSYVAKTRAITAEEAEKAAKGRVWVGSKAKELKLADGLGGYHEAIAAAAAEAKISDYETLLLRAESGLFDRLEEDMPFAQIKEAFFLTRQPQDRFLYWTPLEPLM